MGWTIWPEWSVRTPERWDGMGWDGSIELDAGGDDGILDAL